MLGLTMNNHACLLALVCLVLMVPTSESVMEWLFGSGDDKKGEVKEENAESPIRFEVLSTDEKFLDFALTLKELSSLDACYNIVIYNIKKKCGQLSEEELGKLSVQLLNCQSETEGRAVFPCTASMTLADCTKSMDGTTWNSYQIVGNRARAMCYSTQQLQFRRLTEQTVNKLVSATSDQVKYLNDIKSGQEQLHTLTSETVRRLYDSQQDLLSTQHALREATSGVFDHIAGNVKEILKEKSLIAAGNKELAAMTEGIRAKLEITSGQMAEREKYEHQKHEKLLEDLREIQGKSEESMNKLDQRLTHLVVKYSDLDSQYDGLTANLQIMNHTVTHLMSSVNTMKTHLDQRINWMSELLGGADTKLSAVSCCLLHMAYFFLLAVTAAFIQVSVPLRLAMMVVVVGNVAAELHYSISLDFAGLTVFLITLYAGLKIVTYTGRKFSQRRGEFSSGCQSGFDANLPHGTSELSPQEVRLLLDLIQRFSNTVSGQGDTTMTAILNGEAVRDSSQPDPDPPTPPSSHSPPSTYSSFLNLSRSSNLLNTSLNASVTEDYSLRLRSIIHPLVEGRRSRTASRSSTPVPRDSRSSTPSVSSRCLSNTVTGAQCRMPAVGGADYCRRHAQSAR